MTRSLSSMQEWQRQRDRKLEERRLAKEAAEAMSVRAAPVILKRSEAMVEAARRRQAQAQASRWVYPRLGQCTSIFLSLFLVFTCVCVVPCRVMVCVPAVCLSLAAVTALSSVVTDQAW